MGKRAGNGSKAPGGSGSPSLQIGRTDLRPGEQLGACAGHGDPAVHQHIAAMREPERVPGILLDQQHGQAGLAVEVADGAADRSYGIHVAQLAGLPSPVIQRANEIMAELEKTSGRAVKIDPHAAQQAMLFPESSPLLAELRELDVNSLSPIEALNKLFEWQRKFTK